MKSFKASGLLAALLCVFVTAAVFSGIGLIRREKSKKEVGEYFSGLIGICADDIAAYRQTGDEKRLDQLSCDLNAAYYFEHFNRLFSEGGPHTLLALSEALIRNREKVLPELDRLEEVLNDFGENQSLSWLDGELNRIFNRITRED